MHKPNRTLLPLAAAALAFAAVPARPPRATFTAELTGSAIVPNRSGRRPRASSN